MNAKLKIVIGAVAGTIGALVAYQKSQDVVETLEKLAPSKKTLRSK